MGRVRFLAVTAPLAVLALVQCRTGAPRAPADLPPLRPPAETTYCTDVGQPLPPRTAAQVSDEAIRGVFKTREKDLNSCYKERVKRGYSIEGFVGLRFVINSKGFAQDLCLVEDGTGDAEFIDCMFGELGTWQFPQAAEPTEVRRRFQFRLEDP
ncbi:MAG: AgmX/PglI C-terminal domain-containing protein [Deltaproteobacteria bacterium]|nr:AgmX/PglI C-terminal domain-containing protein [Deltaproteobacteria bacterium]